nr:ATP-binding cassette domain-containing protein [Petrotoga sibirica]
MSSLSFKIEDGETVGLIGLNGAGKSTLIKMMTGILAPTSGEIRVLGNDPFKDRLINNRKISTVFGQRCKLRWDVSPMESYYLIKDMYDINDKDFKNRISYFSEILGLSTFINNPVRTLSLGQKMKAELAGAFLYDPEIIFLDEPTIGLDVLTKDSILNFLNSIKGTTTILLTTHDFDDIEKLCDRVIILHEGRIIHDSPVNDISSIYNLEMLEVIFKDLPENIESKFDFKNYKFDIKKNMVKIDVSSINNKSELIKKIYETFNKDIDFVRVSKISFKDALKYFLNEQLSAKGKYVS